MPDDQYRRTLEELFRLRRFGVQPGLDVIHALLEALDHPERRFPAVHITGSKGKGSVAAMVEALLRAHGRKTGLFTSPHLVSYRERVQVDRSPIPKADVVTSVRRVRGIAAELEAQGAIDHPPTFFEVTTAVALDYFARARVDAAVVEVGMGGRLDATNVLAARTGVITTVELEHTELLGPTVEAIAREKSGIFHRGMTGVVGELPPAADRVVSELAGSAGVPVWHLGREVRVVERTLSDKGQTLGIALPDQRLDRVPLPLFGGFQAGNAALALAAAARFLQPDDDPLEPDRVREALGDVQWRGRLELSARRPDLYLDVAHTPESARSVVHSLSELAPFAEPSGNVLVFGCLRGKRVEAMMDLFSAAARTVVLVPIRSERAIPLPELRAAAAGRFPTIVQARSVAEGLALARAATQGEGFTLVAGSDYLVGELLRAGEGGAEDEPDLSDPGVESTPAPTAAPHRSPA